MSSTSSYTQYAAWQRAGEALMASTKPGACGFANCFVCITPDELVAVESFGKFKGTRNSGCHFVGCDVAGCAIQLKTISLRVQEHTMVTETKTKENVFVELTVAVQIEVQRDKAFEAIYRLASPIQQIESMVKDVVRGTVPKMYLDHLFEAKDEIAHAVQEQLQGFIGEYGWRIHNVLVTDLSPDVKVRNAMNQIDANRRAREAAIEKAEALYQLVVKASEADAESAFLQGQGIARQRMVIAEGIRSAVGSDQALDQQTVQELVLIVQYFDTLEKLANGRNTTVFMPHTVGNLADIAEQIRRGVGLTQRSPGQLTMGGGARPGQ